MKQHPKEQEDLIRTLAGKWRERGAGNEVLGCLGAKSPSRIIHCCSMRLDAPTQSLGLDYEALLHAQLGLAHWMQGAEDLATDHYRKAASIFRIRDHWSAAVVFLALGRSYAQINLPRDAFDCYSQSIQLLGPHDPLRQKAIAWQTDIGQGIAPGSRGPLSPIPADVVKTVRAKIDAGNKLAAEAQLDEAITEYRSALASCDKYADPHLSAECSERLGDAYARGGRAGDALGAYQVAESMYRLARRAGSARRVRAKIDDMIRRSEDARPDVRGAAGLAESPLAGEAGSRQANSDAEPADDSTSAPAGAAGESGDQGARARVVDPAEAPPGPEPAEAPPARTPVQPGPETGEAEEAGGAPGGPDASPLRPAPKPSFMYPRMIIAPVSAARVPAGTPVAAHWLADAFLEATALQINGKSYLLSRVLTGERNLRPRDFDVALFVKGDSMQPNLTEDDCVLLQREGFDLTDADGKMVVFRFGAQDRTGEDEFTVKRYRACGDHALLEPDNSVYPRFALVDAEAFTPKLEKRLKSYYSAQFDPELLIVTPIGEYSKIEGVVVAILKPKDGG